MKHLTSEQLSAHLDRSLSGRAAAEAERHLADCATCREALALFVAQDAELRPALAHEPGEAYFERFAARVGERIRAAGLAGAQSRPEGSRLGRLLHSPRALGLAGAVAVVVVGAGLALMTGREARPPTLRDREIADRLERTERSATDERTLKSARTPRPEPPGTRERTAAPPAEMVAPYAVQGNTEKAAAPLLNDRAASPGRAREVKLNEAGEPQSAAGPFAPRFAAPPPTATGALDRATHVGGQRLASPMEVDRALAKQESLTVAAKERQATGAYLYISPPAASAPSKAAPAISRDVITRETVATGESRLCGEVRDPAGRPVAEAQVVLADLGRATTTDARGAFCVSAPAGEHPLVVMAVGFGESRQQVRVGGEETAMRVTLEPVPVLGGKPGSPTAGLLEAYRKVAGAKAEPRDAYSGLPDSVRAPVREAQRLDALAAAGGSAPLYDAAAARWEQALRSLLGGPLELETRRRAAESRYHAWEASPDRPRAAAAIASLSAYTAMAPPGPERALAARRLDVLRR